MSWHGRRRILNERCAVVNFGDKSGKEKIFGARTMNTDRRESACKDERGVKKTVNSGIWDYSHLKGISEVWHEHQSRDPLAHLHTTSHIDSSDPNLCSFHEIFRAHSQPHFPKSSHVQLIGLMYE